MLRLAVIGLGGRSSGVIGIIRKISADVRVVAIHDADPRAARERVVQFGQTVDEIQWFDSAEKLLENSREYDGLMIGTRDDTHTAMAVIASETKLPLYLEKPVAVDRAQLETLHAAFAGREDDVVVSFPLRVTPLFSKVMEIISSGRLGKINQVQAVNNVEYGGVYFGQWYRTYKECRGLWLQKATHDFDCINLLADSEPLMVAATSSRLVYGGNMPNDLKCSACRITDSCPESPKNIALRGDDGGMGKGDHWCAFSKGIENQDAGSALLLYANGIHASYSQNFLARRTMGRRGAIVMGYTASLEYDWKDNSIRVVDHHKDHVEELTVEASQDHGGGDEVLAMNFIDLMRGRSKSISDLCAGIRSAAMCIAAMESARSRTFQTIPIIGETIEYDHAPPPVTAER
jgi:predicted dehydrogenase